MCYAVDLKHIKQRVAEAADPASAAASSRFFKTGPGEYGEGDVFVGLRVPTVRRLAREFRDAPLDCAEQLLLSPIHEERLLALFLLIQNFRRSDNATRTRIYRYYLDHTRCINNWDLVDSSAEHIVGAYLLHRERQPLYRLARSPHLWERRIAIIATFHYIKQGQFDNTLAIAELLLGDRHDLIHKAVGWMLREVGKRDAAAARQFLRRYYRIMPRTMLRYAIERFPETERQQYLTGALKETHGLI